MPSKPSFSVPFLYVYVGCGLVLSAATLLTACTDAVEEARKVVHAGSYENPILKQRSDPWAYRTDDGTYYFTSGVPEFNRIELRRASSIDGLGQAAPKVIWRKHWQGPMSAHIWAPELHRINNVWYIYFAAGKAENVWDVSLYVLSNTADDPLQGEWKEEGKIETAEHRYSVDPTTFEHRGQRYLVWGQTLPDSKDELGLYISAMASPTKLTGPEVLIAQATHDWEKRSLVVNSGAAALVKNGRVYMTYWAGGTDHHGAIGLLWADEEADLLEPASWHKLAEPILASNEEAERYGPAHSSFTLAEDGKTDVLLYHARDYSGLRGDALTDPNRHTWARTFYWDEHGWPILDSAQPD
jgi:GH43 family beta-xylosidase